VSKERKKKDRSYKGSFLHLILEVIHSYKEERRLRGVRTFQGWGGSRGKAKWGRDTSKVSGSSVAKGNTVKTTREKYGAGGVAAHCRKSRKGKPWKEIINLIDHVQST